MRSNFQSLTMNNWFISTPPSLVQLCIFQCYQFEYRGRKKEKFCSLWSSHITSCFLSSQRYLSASQFMTIAVSKTSALHNISLKLNTSKNLLQLSGMNIVMVGIQRRSFPVNHYFLTGKSKRNAKSVWSIASPKYAKTRWNSLASKLKIQIGVLIRVISSVLRSGSSRLVDDYQAEGTFDMLKDHLLTFLARCCYVRTLLCKENGPWSIKEFVLFTEC